MPSCIRSLRQLAPICFPPMKMLLMDFIVLGQYILLLPAMKIYFFTTKLNFRTAGGSIEEFDLMMRTLQNMGHDVVCVTTFCDGNDMPTRPPYVVLEENIADRDLLGLARGIYCLFKKYEKDADIFHIDGHVFLYGAGAYRRIGGRIPVSAFFNRELGSFPEDESVLIAAKKRSLATRIRKSLRWLLERTLGMWLARALDIKMFITPLYRDMYQNFGLSGGIMMVFADPLDFQNIMRQNGITEHTYRDRLPASRPPFRIFFSSRMVAGKGFDLLLAGFARVRNKEHFKLVLGGDGPESERIHASAQERGITRYIDFLGWTPKEQVYEQFKKADMFVQVGWRREGASMTLLHALAFGVPSIVPRGSGMAWQAGNAALTVENGNHEELARTIEKLAENRTLRAELSANCYRRITDGEIDHRKTIARWVSAMQDVAGKRSASSA